MSNFFKKVWGTSSTETGARRGRVSSSSSTTIDSIEVLNQKEEHLEKRRELIEKNIEAEHAKAKKYYADKKVTLAKTCLKKKKMYEKNLEDLGNLIMKVNEQKIMLENAQTTAETLKAIAGATKATKGVLKDNKIEDVDKLMDEIAADTDMMRDISDRIAEPSPFMAELDDDDLMAELEEFNQEGEAQRLETELMKPNTIPTEAFEDDLPELTVHKPTPIANKKPPTGEEEELAALEAELNG